MTKRIDEYDIAKGIGIILVVFGHTITNVKVVQFIYSFHMPLFFILSGLVMKEKKTFQSIKDILISEKILFVNYFFWSFVGLILKIFSSIILNRNLDILNIKTSLFEIFTLYGQGVLWFLSTLAVAKVIVSSVLNRINNKKILFLLSCLSFVILGDMYHSLIEIRLSNIHWISYYVIFMLFRSILMSCFVMLGYSIKSIIWKLINGKFFVLTLMSLVLFFNVVLLFFISRYEYISLSFGYSYIALLQALTGFIGIIGISSLLTKIKYIGDIFKVIGINSLFIMVTHVYLETPTWSVGLKISSNLFISECIIVFLIVLLEFFLCRFIKPYFDFLIKKLCK